MTGSHEHRYIAFDSATTTGFAYRSGDIWVTGVFNPRDKARMRGVIAEAMQCGVECAVIEDCYKSPSVRTLKVLQDCTTRIAVCCEDFGLYVGYCYPSTWQSACGLKGKRDELKKGAKKLAEILGAVRVTQDEADAVCLCDYAERNQILK